MITLDVIQNEVKLAEATRREAVNLSRSKRAGRGKPVRWVNVPQSSLPGAPAVQGVALAPNEDVQWTWTHTPNGSYVSGYNIVRRLTPPAVILTPRQQGKNLSRPGRTGKRQRPFPFADSGLRLTALRVATRKEVAHA